jgi:hypothetical protein
VSPCCVQRPRKCQIVMRSAAHHSCAAIPCAGDRVLGVGAGGHQAAALPADGAVRARRRRPRQRAARGVRGVRGAPSISLISLGLDCCAPQPMKPWDAVSQGFVCAAPDVPSLLGTLLLSNPTQKRIWCPELTTLLSIGGDQAHQEPQEAGDPVAGRPHLQAQPHRQGDRQEAQRAGGRRGGVGDRPAPAARPAPVRFSEPFTPFEICTADHSSMRSAVCRARCRARYVMDPAEQPSLWLAATVACHHRSARKSSRLLLMLNILE